jgi:hypothetical protein
VIAEADDAAVFVALVVVFLAPGQRRDIAVSGHGDLFHGDRRKARLLR